MRKIVAGNWKMNGTSKNLSEIKKISDEFIALFVSNTLVEKFGISFSKFIFGV